METIGIELTRIFVKVVQHGGFTKAANFLKIPKSTVSKAITKLEKQTGTKLLIRTTRHHTLTAAGRTFYEACLSPIQALEDAQKTLYGQDSILSGPIKLSASEDIGGALIAPIIAELSKKYPDLTFDLRFTNRMVDLVKEGFDLAIRIGKLQESSLKARKIGQLKVILVGSPDYLSKKNPIKKPKDLASHNCISLTDSVLSKVWRLTNNKETVEVNIQSKIETNHMNTILTLAKNGGGVALVPDFICQQDLKKKKLVRVLPEWCNISPNVSLVSPLSVNSSARVKLVSDYIFSALQKTLKM